MTRRLLTFLLLIVVGIFIISIPAAAQTDTPTIHYTTASVSTHPSQGDVRVLEGTQAELFSTENGVTMNFRTDALEMGHVYTAWWALINNPENCATSPCTAKDILGNTDGVKAEVTYADSILASKGGKMEFAAYMAAGEVPEAWFGNGLTNPMGAEIHIIINDHGSVLPDLAENMLNSYRGGCTDESLPPPFPDTAKGDGEPGPNTCRLVQFTIFQQVQ